MAVQLPFVSLLLFGATVLLVAAAAVGWRQQEVPGAVAFTVLNLLSAAWAATYGMQLVFTTLEAQMFWSNAQYFPGLLTIIAFAVFVMFYTGRQQWLTRGRVVALSIIPVVTSICVWIPPLRPLVWQRAELVRTNGFLIADITHGPLFDIAVTYSYLVVFGSFGLLFLTILRTRALYQKQVAIIMVTSFVPFVGSAVAYVLDLTVIDYTPIGLAVWGVGVAVALSRYQLLDVFPVPRDRIINQVDTGIIVTDGRDRIVDINPAAAGILGDDTFVGRRLSDISSEAAPEMVDMEVGTVAELHVGDEAYFECTKSILESSGGFGDTYLYILTDITDRRRRQEALEETNERLDSFAEVLTHDLRNPLSVATGSAELARRDPEDRHFDRLFDAHDRMEEIIDNMLMLARSGDSVAEMEPVDIERSAREAWSLVLTAEATLSVEETATIEADPKRLKQLFENLFRNAVEHGGDPVTVRVGPTADGFFVADDGPGIDVDEREAVFQSGVSSETEGTGVGLAIVKTVVDGHGWSISVTDSWAGGARFEIET